MTRQHMMHNRCKRCGSHAPGSFHLHLPWQGAPLDFGRRFYSDPCWRNMKSSALVVWIVCIILIGGLAGHIWLLVMLG
jgi:hypothetical protein